jgi:hypothetical protein
MNYEAFRAAWDDALRRENLLTAQDRSDESIELGSMTRRYTILLGLVHSPPAETFLGTLELGWKWDALKSARARTTEEDVLTELLGREEAGLHAAEPPWLRVDVKLRGRLPWDTHLALPAAEVWRVWVATVAKQVDPLPPAMKVDPGHEGTIRGWRGEPEAQVRCGPRGELWLLGIDLAAWQMIQLPRQQDAPDHEPDEQPHEQLAVFARRLRTALDAWKKALKALSPSPAQLH